MGFDDISRSFKDRRVDYIKKDEKPQFTFKCVFCDDSGVEKENTGLSVNGERLALFCVCEAAYKLKETIGLGTNTLILPK